MLRILFLLLIGTVYTSNNAHAMIRPRPEAITPKTSPQKKRRILTTPTKKRAQEISSLRELCLLNLAKNSLYALYDIDITQPLDEDIQFICDNITRERDCKKAILELLETEIRQDLFSPILFNRQTEQNQKISLVNNINQFHIIDLHDDRITIRHPECYCENFETCIHLHTRTRLPNGEKPTACCNVLYSQNGNDYIIFGSDNGSLYFYNIEKEIIDWSIENDHHEESLPALSGIVILDNNLIATTSEETFIKIWDFSKKSCIHQHNIAQLMNDQEIDDINNSIILYDIIALDNNRVALGTSNPGAKIIDLSDPKKPTITEIEDYTEDENHTNSFSTKKLASLNFNNHKILVSSIENGYAKIWSTYQTAGPYKCYKKIDLTKTIDVSCVATINVSCLENNRVNHDYILTGSRDGILTGYDERGNVIFSIEVSESEEITDILTKDNDQKFIVKSGNVIQCYYLPEFNYLSGDIPFETMLTVSKIFELEKKFPDKEDILAMVHSDWLCTLNALPLCLQNFIHVRFGSLNNQ